MHNFHLPAGNLDAIAVIGPDAAKLLQGQLTCDVEALADSGFTRGALCNNKGRVIATFILVRQGANFHVVLTQGLGAIFLQALKKYQPFYKCELRPAAGQSWGVVGEDLAKGFAPAGLPPPARCQAHADGWICTLDGAAQQYVFLDSSAMPSPPGTNLGTINDWLVTGMHSGQFPFTVEDSELYTPQELHLDRHGYVSFTKGCYTGQEIVARLHYRGKLKRLLFLLEAPSMDVPQAGSMEIYDLEGTVLGTSFKTLASRGMQYALAALPAELENKPPPFVKNRAGLQFSLRVF